MIAGLIGLVPLLLSVVVLPAATLLQEEPRQREHTESHSHQAQISLLVPAAIASLSPGLPPFPVNQPAAFALPVLVAQQAAPPQTDAMPTWAMLMPFLALFYVLNLAISITLVFAGWRMRQLRSYGLSFAGAILAMFPCTFGWIIGLPMGIWAFSLLRQPEVREAFEA
jgi:hypothetical protein